MDTYTVMIEGGLSVNIKDNNDPLARQTKVLMKERVVTAGGILKKSEVYTGTIFVDVDKKDAADAVVKMFSVIDGAVAQIVDPLQAIYRKAQLRPVKIEQKAV
jgi:hypothetical protein